MKQETPKIMHNCPKCGLDLVEREGSKPVCTRIDCGGIILSNETLREWVLKEEYKQLTDLEIAMKLEEIESEELKQETLEELTEKILEITNNSDYRWNHIDSHAAYSIRQILTETLPIHGVMGSFIKTLIWDDETKIEHVYKCVSASYVDLPVQGDWKSHIAICDEGNYEFKATLWLMNGGYGIAQYCKTIEEAKVEAEKWWINFVSGFLNCT